MLPGTDSEALFQRGEDRDSTEMLLEALSSFVLKYILFRSRMAAFSY